ncbi:uncharacterized protein BDW43DRAFT_313441 [Aspergillus alliaceus]|uniref:uncharacterized protein n=1 Tax=Petromyces alliaceus TaxID=209559 RepID=UPI0012A5DBA9|nr:uncharacterized protein BDW43DRAFT_313441 [Aspergillus alliaceus]KAB8231116.1 hypothetical protein BDW43DRAFT_313441 [Aspergillus alliaceus]
MNETLQYCSDDGIIMTLFDRRRPRIDPVICANILTLFYAYNRGHELPRTREWLYNVLRYRAYLDGTLYYATAESFLYHMCRLVRTSKDPTPEWLLRKRVEERIKAPGDALALAMRLAVCDALSVANQQDLAPLLLLQCEDGGWGASRMYRFPQLDVWEGNRGVTTALAVKALKSIRQTEKQDGEGLN